MALYARTLLIRETPRPLFFSPSLFLLLSLSFSQPPFPRCVSLSPTHTLSFPMHPLRSSRHFPISLTGATALFVPLLRHGGAFECNHQPALRFLPFFLPSFFSLSFFFWSPLRGLIRRNGMMRRRDATEEKSVVAVFASFFVESLGYAYKL